MEHRLKCDWRLLRRIAVYTAIFGLAAHAFCYFNTMFSHDSMLVFQNDQEWQISLGRFLQPAYVQLRGPLCAPFLLGMLSLIYLAASIYLIARMLELRSWPSILLVCAILVTCPALTYANATYLPWIDIYMLALLLSVLSVWLYNTFKFGFLFGMVPLCLSIGLYQSYIDAAIALGMILLIKYILDALPAKEIILRALKGLAMVAGGILLYYLAYRIVLFASGIAPATAENALSGFGGYTLRSVLGLLYHAYDYTIDSFLKLSPFHPGLQAVINVLLCILTCLGVLRIARASKIKGLPVVLLIGLILLLPFGVNAVYVPSKGFLHALMTFPYTFLYVFTVFIFEYASACGLCCPRALPAEAVKQRRWTWTHILRAAVPVLFAILLVLNVSFSNRLYLRKTLEYQATQSVMTRVIDRMEQTDGYLPGQTPVAVVGQLGSSAISKARPGYESIAGVGMFTNYSITYYATCEQYFQNILGYPVNLVPEKDMLRYADLPAVQQMPGFPAQDCCQMLDGVLIVKLS